VTSATAVQQRRPITDRRKILVASGAPDKAGRLEIRAPLPSRLSRNAYRAFAIFKNLENAGPQHLCVLENMFYIYYTILHSKLEKPKDHHGTFTSCQLEDGAQQLLWARDMISHDLEDRDMSPCDLEVRT